MNALQIRLLQERTDLQTKCDQLVAFLDEEEKLPTIIPLQKDLLGTQASAMYTYLHILTIRINLLNATDTSEETEESQPEQETK